MVKGTSRIRASVWASSVLPQPGRPDQQDVGLGELDLITLAAVSEALVVVVHGDGEYTLGVVLPDHVVGQYLANLCRGWARRRGS